MSHSVTTRVWESSAHTQANKLLLLVKIADNVKDDTVSHAGNEYLASMIRLSVRQTQRLVADLVESGELYVRPGNGRANKSTMLVTVGLDQDAIESRLIEHLEMSPFNAKSVTLSILEKRVTFYEKGCHPEQKRVTKKAVKGDTVEHKTPTTVNRNTNTEDSDSDHPRESLPSKVDQESFPPKSGEESPRDSEPKPSKEKPAPVTPVLKVGNQRPEEKSSAKKEASQIQEHIKPMQTWIDAVGKEYVSSTFKWNSVVRYSKELGQTTALDSITCAGLLYRAWLGNIAGKPLLTWSVSEIRTEITRALGLCDLGVTEQDVGAYVTELRKQTFWKGKRISFKYVSENITAWKAEKVANNGQSTENATAVRSGGESILGNNHSAGAKDAETAPAPGVQSFGPGAFGLSRVRREGGN